MRKLLMAASLFAAAPLAAQTIVTPTNAHGWAFFDGKPGTPPSAAQITGTMPGPTAGDNGSLQLTVTNGTQQPAAFYALGSGITLGSLDNLSFSYFAGVGEVSSPTVRFYLTGIPGDATTSSMGWDVASGTSGWTNESLSLSSGDFFFRTVGGQVNDACATGSQTQSFSDRMQTIGAWDAACNGSAGTFNLSNAIVSAVEVDYGSFPGLTTPSNVFLDNLSFQFGTADAQSFNFETDAPSSATPEPGTMTLLATGLVGLAGFSRRKRRR